MHQGMPFFGGFMFEVAGIRSQGKIQLRRKVKFSSANSVTAVRMILK